MSTDNKCLICGFENFNIRDGSSSREYICECQRCGKYSVTHRFLTFRGDEKYVGRWHLLSGLVREINENGESPNILYEDLDEWFADSRIPKDDDVERKAKKILSYLKRHSSHYGNSVVIELSEDRSVGYARNDEEFDALIHLLKDSGLLEGGFPRTHVDQGDFLNTTGKVTLTAQGWQIAKDQGANPSQSMQGFIAIRFDDDADPFIKAIEEGITAAGFQPNCIKEKHYPERVMDKAIGEIRRSRFVVVDLTKNRCAVSFESGFAYALGIECIPIWQKGSDKIEDFYVKHYKYIEYENAEDLRQKIETAIKARIPLPKSTNQ